MSKTSNLQGQLSKIRITNLKRTIWIILAMIISTIAMRYFVIYTNIFSSGITGLSQGIAYTISIGLGLTGDQAILMKNVGYYIFNVGINLFITIFTWRKFGKEFTLWSIGAFFAGMSFALFFQYVPGFNVAGFIPGFVPTYHADGTNSADMAITFAVTCIAGGIGGILSGISTGIIWKVGACSLGFDPISKHLAKTKKISAKKGIFIFSLVNSFLWTLITESMMGYVNDFSSFIGLIFNARFLGTIIFLILNSVAFGWIYPATKKVLVEVNTDKGDLIVEKLRMTNYHRGYSINQIKGGYSQKDRTIIKSILMSEELYDYINFMGTIDGNAFIATYEVYKVFGVFDSRSSNLNELMTHKEEEEMRKTIEAEAQDKTSELFYESKNKKE